MFKRKTDQSAGMLMFNTVLFGVGAGLVASAWIIQSKASNLANVFEPDMWTVSQQLLLATVAILVSGFFHSLTVIYPKIRSRETERRLATERASKMESLAIRDPLTDLHNRRFFDEALIAYLEEFAKTRAQFGLIMIDIDQFKAINDEHGHDIGDAVLKEIARTIAGLAREHDIVARIGGEEFAILAPYAEAGDLPKIGQRYRGAIEKLAIDLGSTALKTTISVGIAGNKGISDPADLYKAADRKLYEAKNTGRNRVAV